MKIISIGQVVELNKQLKEKELPYEIHLRDACGGQSFSIKVIDSNQEEQEDRLHSVLSSYFESARMKVIYAPDGYHFTIQ